MRFLGIQLMKKVQDAASNGENITTAAAQQTGKREPELGGHGVVEQRIDSAVYVDRKTTAQQEPAVFVAPSGE